MIVFWIFKDPNTGKARMFSVDPSTFLPNHAEASLTVDSGVLLDTAVNQLIALKKDIEGIQGDEAYVKVTINNPAAMPTF